MSEDGAMDFLRSCDNGSCVSDPVTWMVVWAECAGVYEGWRVKRRSLAGDNAADVVCGITLADSKKNAKTAQCYVCDLVQLARDLVLLARDLVQLARDLVQLARDLVQLARDLVQLTRDVVQLARDLVQLARDLVQLGEGSRPI